VTIDESRRPGVSFPVTGIAIDFSSAQLDEFGAERRRRRHS